MGGFFGIVSKRDALADVFFGTDYHSHLGTRRAGVAAFDEKIGLYYHGLDCSKSIFWADKETGISKNFWLRAIGWYTVAMIDIIEILRFRSE